MSVPTSGCFAFTESGVSSLFRITVMMRATTISTVRRVVNTASVNIASSSALLRNSSSTSSSLSASSTGILRASAAGTSQRSFGGHAPASGKDNIFRLPQVRIRRMLLLWTHNSCPPCVDVTFGPHRVVSLSSSAASPLIVTRARLCPVVGTSSRTQDGRGLDREIYGVLETRRNTRRLVCSVFVLSQRVYFVCVMFVLLAVCAAGAPTVFAGT